MPFLSPAVLWALLALAVPVLLHLFYFRRFRKVEFSDVRFLKEVKEETQNRSRLRNLLVLALRLLAFAAIILAFAQPYIAADTTAAPGESQTVTLYIDNSFSMSAQASDVSLLDKAQQRAREVISAYPAQTQYQILSNDLTGASARLLSREDALAAVDAVAIAPQSRTAATITGRIATSAGVSQTRRTAYLLSDFQAGFSKDLSAIAELDSSLNLVLVPLEAVAQRNVAIDTAYLAAPVQLVGEPSKLIVKLTNYGQQEATAIRLSVRAGGRQQPFGTVTLPAGQSTTDTLTLSVLPAGTVEAVVALTDFPLEFDDEYRLSFTVRESLQGLIVSNGTSNPNLLAAFPAGAALEFTSVQTGGLNYSGLGNYDLIVLDDLPEVSSGLTTALLAYAERGGKMLVFPAATGNPSGYSALLANAGLPTPSTFVAGTFGGGQLNTNSFVFTDVFESLPRNLRLPATTGRYVYPGTSGETILTYRDGRAFMLGAALGQGRVYLCAAPLSTEYSELARNGEVFVPMLYRMALSGATSRAASLTVGANAVVSLALPNTTGDAALRLAGSTGEFIPAQRRLGDRITLAFSEAPTTAGFYEVLDAADSSVATLAFNYSRLESPQKFSSRDELAATGLPIYDGNAAGSLVAAIGQNEVGTPWWPYLIVLALLALLAEALVLRFWQPQRAVGRATLA